MSDIKGIEEEIFGPEYFHDLREEMEIHHRKNQETITKFLGKGPQTIEAFDTPSYYGLLLAWCVKCIFASPGWEIISIHGHNFGEPFFSNIQTGYVDNESCLVSGSMLVKRTGTRMAVTISGIGNIQIAASEDHEEEVLKLVQEIKDYLNKHNFYRGKRINFSDRISFLNAGQRDWDSVILDPDMKESIRANSIGFLKNISRMKEFGIPPKRGIILAGDPGTGKTIICKALMSEAKDITCIVAAGFGEYSEKYISDLFSLAQDLSPSIIFMEDIDFIGRERHGFYHGSPPLLTLLAEMDGISEKTAIVTVATSNFFETLDKALSERPSRFDCVYRLNCPNLEQRAELVENISEKIVLPQDIKEYIVKRTHGFTPAQVESVVRHMAIPRIVMEEETMHFSRSDVDSAIIRVNHKQIRPIGFNAMS